MPILDLPGMQRLRRVAQTSLTSSVFPSATGSRFEHSLGAMHLAGLAFDAAIGGSEPEVVEGLLEVVRGDFPEFATATKRHIREAVMAAALLHDLGHPPFSHALEPVLEERISRGRDHGLREALAGRRAPHEAAGVVVFRRDILPELGRWGELIQRIYESDPQGPGAFEALHGLIDGEVDIDRLDYQIRDAQRAGTEFGAVDWRRVLSAFRLREYAGGWRFAPDVAARSAVESLLIGRTQYHRWMLFHHRVVAANLALLSAVRLLEGFAESQEAATLPHGAAALRAIFGPLMPPLEPAQETFASLLARTPHLEAIQVGAGEAQSTLAEQLLADEAAIDAHRLAGHVDDAAVVDGLWRARTVARALLEHAEGHLRQRLRQFVGYVDVALDRTRTVLSVWKTETHMSKIAERLFPDLQTTVHGVLDELEQGGRLPPGLREVAEAQRVAGPLTYFNWLVDETLFRADYRAALEASLDGAPVDAERPGHWRLAYPKFRPLAHDLKAAVVWEEDGRPLEVRGTSALVEALDRVDKHRLHLLAYHFYDSTDVGKWSREDRHNERAALAGQFITLFPAHVARFLPQAHGKPKEDA